MDSQSESDGAIVSHSVAWAQMGRYHNDGYTYYIVNEVVPFSHIFVNHPVSSADPRSSIRNLIH